jgi:hypothetical protein
MRTKTDIREHLSGQALARKRPKTVAIVAKSMTGTLPPRLAAKHLRD